MCEVDDGRVGAKKVSQLIWTSDDKRQEFYLGDGPDFLEAINGQVRIVVTSPPYAVGMEYEKDVGYEEHRQLIRRFARGCFVALEPGGYAFVNFGNNWPAPYSMEGMYWEAFQDAGVPLFCQRIWAKAFNRLGAPRAYHYRSVRPLAQFEYLWTFRKPAPKGSVWDPPRDRSLSLKGVWDTADIAGRALDTGHPAAYPLVIPEWALQVHCDRDSDQLVVDPFAGRGTTLMAARNLGLCAIGVDNDSDYAALAVGWLDQMTEEDGDEGA